MKKMILSLLLCLMACTSACAMEIPEVAEVRMRAVESADDAIAYAKEIWQYDFIAGYRDGLQWSAQWIDARYEIYADDAETGERALSMAVRPDGRIAYLLNVESGARQAADYGTDVYDQDEALLSDMEQFAIEAFDALVPDVNPDQLVLDSSREESNLEDCYFLSFWQTLSRTRDLVEQRFVYVQIAPQVRVTFWVDEFSLSNERLEPNMGNG